MAENNDKQKAAPQHATDGAAATPGAPLARIWEDPIGTGDPVPFDPTLFEPPMSAEEIKKLLDEQEEQ